MAIKNLKEVEKALNLKDGDLKAIIEDKDDKVLDLSGLEIVPKAEYETRVKAIEDDGFAKGKTEGETIIKRDLKKKYGLDVKKSEPLDAFMPALEEAIGKKLKIEPDVKVKEVEKDRDSFKEQLETVTAEKTSLENGYKAEKKAAKIHAAITGALPKFGNSAGELSIPTEDAAILVNTKAAAAGLTADIDEATGMVYFKRGDEPIKDKNRKYEKPEVVLKELFTPYVRQTTGGSGGDDLPGGKTNTTMAAFIKEMQDKGHSAGSTEFNKEMNDRMKDNPNYFKV